MMKMTDTAFREKMGLYLLGEMKPAARKEFLASLEEYPEFNRQFQEYISLNDLVGGSFKENAPSSSSGFHRLTGLLPANNTFAVIGAAAAIILAVFVFFPKRSGHAEILVNSSLGKCLTNDNPASSPGIMEGGSLASGANSICDLAFPGGRGLKARILPDSKISVSRSNNTVIIHLHKGDILARTGNHTDKEQVILVVNGYTYRFLGTSVSASSREGKNRISVVSGKVQMKHVSKIPEFREQLKPEEITVAEDIPADPAAGTEGLTISANESVTIAQSAIRHEKTDKSLRGQLADSFSALDKTIRVSGGKIIQPENTGIILKQQLNTFKQNADYTYRVLLKDGRVIKADKVYHESGYLHTERLGETLKFKKNRIKRVESR